MKNLKRIVMVVFLSGTLLFSACSTKNVTRNVSQIKGYPIASEVFTTLTKTVIPVPVPSISPKLQPPEISKFAEYGYGVWHYGPGLGYEKRLDLLPEGYSATSVTKSATLLRFFAVTDVHITDKESPAGIINMGLTSSGSPSAYSPSMLYTTHVLDAAIQTVNALHKVDPFDFGISLGDNCNNTQYNELRWFMDILDGKIINPDSGTKEDPLVGPNNDYQDEFKASGLDKTIPWYQTFGNHDNLWMGIWPHNDYLREAHTSENILNMGKIITDPLHVDSRGFYVGVVNGNTELGEVIGAGSVADTPHLKVVADPNRRPLSRLEWMSEFFKTSTTPVGHGFTQSNLDNDFACYSFEPKSDLPLKVIVLDDLQSSDVYDIRTQGGMDEKRYQWLIQELDQGQAEGKLMIISSHIPIPLIGYHVPAPFMDATRLLKKLQSNPGYPNLIMWICGHVHRNVCTVYKSPDPLHPELGFWMVETSSLKDFPQQFRTFDINRNSDNTISIFVTNIDPAVREGSLAALSRSNAIASWEIFVQTPLNKSYLLPSGSYNAELVKLLSPAMMVKIQKYGKP